MAGPEPPKPPDFDIMIWFDLSPLRPADYWETEAMSWTEAVAMQNAYNDGLHRARTEAKARDEMDRDDD